MLQHLHWQIVIVCELVRVGLSPQVQLSSYSCDGPPHTPMPPHTHEMECDKRFNTTELEVQRYQTTQST